MIQAFCLHLRGRLFPPEKRKVGGSIPPLTTPSDLRRWVPNRGLRMARPVAWSQLWSHSATADSGRDTACSG
jgi:hypothetical protein